LLSDRRNRYEIIILSLILTLAFGSLIQTNAQTAQKINVLVGNQKKASRSQITVKFVSLIEDSRCPDEGELHSRRQRPNKSSSQQTRQRARNF
jgi:hypothetical protein